MINNFKLRSWDYDLKNEFAKKKEFTKRYPNIKRWLDYKVSSIEFDCDVCEYAMEVYKSKYEFLQNGNIQNQRKYNSKELKKEIKVGDTIYRGDTLNSFSEPFMYFLKYYFEKRYGNKSGYCICYDRFYQLSNLQNNSYRVGNKLSGKYKIKDREKNLSIIQKEYNQIIDDEEFYRWLFDNFDIIFSDENIGKIEYAKDIILELEKFAFLTHTIGSIFPAPLHFNKERSKFGKYEFPDLMLCQIYLYYENKKKYDINDVQIKRPIINLLDEGTDISYTTKWLDVFQKWDSFVIAYNYQTYVEKNSDGTFGKPHLLWNEHSLEKTELPKIINVLEYSPFFEYLKKNNIHIEERGKQIIKYTL